MLPKLITTNIFRVAFYLILYINLILFFLSFFSHYFMWCVCVCGVSMFFACMWMQVWVFASACGSPKLILGIIFHFSSTLFTVTGCLSQPRAHKYSQPPRLEIQVDLPIFIQVSGNQNLRSLLVCIKCLSPKQSPHPIFSFSF